MCLALSFSTIFRNINTKKSGFSALHPMLQKALEIKDLLISDSHVFSQINTVHLTFSNSGQSTNCNLAGDPAVKFILRKSENSRQARHNCLLPSKQGLNRIPFTLIVRVLSY